MSIKSDKWIRRMAEGDAQMIEPFAPELVRQNEGGKIVSYGTSSYGYDVRVANEFKIFTNINSTIVDPKNFDERNFVDFTGDVCIIPPNSFALARTVEYFRIPRDVLVICLGKSTYARCGVVVNCTPLEPGWRGTLTIEISNTTPLPKKASWPSFCQSMPDLKPRASTMPTRIGGTSMTARKIGSCGSKSMPRVLSQFTPTANVATLTDP